MSPGALVHPIPRTQRPQRRRRKLPHAQKNSSVARYAASLVLIRSRRLDVKTAPSGTGFLAARIAAGLGVLYRDRIGREMATGSPRLGIDGGTLERAQHVFASILNGATGTQAAAKLPVGRLL